VAVDSFELLEWLVQREEKTRGGELGGPELMMQASHLNAGDQYAWAGVTRAAAELRRRKWIDWRFEDSPGYSQEPPPHLFTDQDMQRVRGIMVTTEGFSALAARRPPAPTHQINIFQSTVGQLALGDIANIDLFLILDAAERCLDNIEGPDDAKEQARGVLRRMREAGTSIATTTAAEVLAAAVRRSFGLG
jgi:hypothetical protein